MAVDSWLFDKNCATASVIIYISSMASTACRTLILQISIDGIDFHDCTSTRKHHQLGLRRLRVTNNDTSHKTYKCTARKRNSKTVNYGNEWVRSKAFYWYYFLEHPAELKFLRPTLDILWLRKFLQRFGYI